MAVLAALDLGTISTRLLVAAVDGGRLTPLHQDMKITRLGEGVDTTGCLAGGAMERTAAAVGDFAAAARQYGAAKILAVATSAVRDAANGAAFCDLVRQSAGVTVRVIPGAREAALTFAGAARGLAAAGAIVVLDVGGGSTEIIGGTPAGMASVQSIDAGAVRMTERYLHTDPIDPTEYATLLKDLRDLFAPAAERVNHNTFPTLVAVGGTATTLAAIRQRLSPYDPTKTHGFVLTAAALAEVNDELLCRTTAERRQMPGLQPARADLVVAGAAIIRTVLECGGWLQLTVSEADILHGIIWDALEADA